MNRRCIIAPTASKDLAKILDYFLAKNVEAGDKFAIKFEQKCRYLAMFPMMGRSYPELGSSLRGIPLDDYVIFYAVTDLCIEIVRVVSGYQDLRSLFPIEE
ncbi:type II toxin-antitoxin system RelE/ParE family toxin [Altericista sp. CCNU0014]|uniref:type II toxin-antitoxin system RelE/ParE family toxin n=1 Tax=Altericista sp. CCNU0014 TaxID=3082949 RepID=UPI00384E640B